MSDNDCPVPEPFSGVIGNILFLTFASKIVLAGIIIIVRSGLPFLIDLIENMNDGC